MPAWQSRRLGHAGRGVDQRAQVGADPDQQRSPRAVSARIENELAELDPAEAEEMILKLSTFFRSSLSLDPSADVTLSEEIALQSLYLDIERVRFPKRLKVELDIPQNLETARLPALILQPIVENAIKYAVTPSETGATATYQRSDRQLSPPSIFSNSPIETFSRLAISSLVGERPSSTSSPTPGRGPT